MSNGQGRDALNLAACYACGLLPETSCENFNMYLDRGMLVGTLDNPEFGFFSDWDNSNRFKRTVIKSQKVDDSFNPRTVQYKKNGTDLNSQSYSDIWDYVMDETDDENDCELFLSLKCQSAFNVEKPIFGETIVLGEERININTDLLWKKSKVLFFFADNISEYNKALKTGWHCVCVAAKKITANELLNMIEGE